MQKPSVYQCVKCGVTIEGKDTSKVITEMHLHIALNHKGEAKQRSAARLAQLQKLNNA